MHLKVLHAISPCAMILAARGAWAQPAATRNPASVGVKAAPKSADNDDNLPLAGDSLRDTLFPYTKSASVFPGFVYSLNGGAMKDIKDPATTMMGYIPGQGGYAVVYADGHVQWKTELPPSGPPN